MKSLREEIADRRATNAKALAALGFAASTGRSASYLRTIREGNSVTIFTIGYEKRTSEDLIAQLRDAGVVILADIREKPISRRAEFRGEALRAACETAGIGYEAWPQLGSTESQRDDLHESGDIEAFHKRFRTYAKRHLMPEIKRLAKEALHQPIALFCYERAHAECHRMVIAELLADEIKAGITAIV